MDPPFRLAVTPAVATGVAASGKSAADGVLDAHLPADRAPPPRRRRVLPDFHRSEHILSCGICLEPLNDHEEIFHIHAKQRLSEHEYHTNCLRTWVSTPPHSIKCPECQIADNNMKQ